MSWFSSGERVSVPTVLQLEAAECGAATVGMVLGYYGCHVPLEQLRLEGGVGRGGAKAGNMMRAAKLHGFEASAFKAEPKDLESFPLPLIVHWNMAHFVVVEGYDPRHVFLNDPAFGPR